MKSDITAASEQHKRLTDATHRSPNICTPCRHHGCWPCAYRTSELGPLDPYTFRSACFVTPNHTRSISHWRGGLLRVEQEAIRRFGASLVVPTPFVPDARFGLHGGLLALLAKSGSPRGPISLSICKILPYLAGTASSPFWQTSRHHAFSNSRCRRVTKAALSRPAGPAAHRLPCRRARLPRRPNGPAFSPRLRDRPVRRRRHWHR